MESMKRLALSTLLALALLLALGAALAALQIRRGFSAHGSPGVVETFLARAMRRAAVPSAVRSARSPVTADEAALRRARAHFADHCAFCHGADGRGDTEIGRNLYPKPPDLAGPVTQALTDGELHAVIENGVRLSGMPAFRGEAGHDEAGNWELVALIRRFPLLTAGEKAELDELVPHGEGHEHGPESSGATGGGEPAGSATSSAAPAPHGHGDHPGHDHGSAASPRGH
jgi:mono/diheme cytochrome c family protein